MSALLKRICLDEEVKEMAETSAEKCESKGGIEKRYTVKTRTM